MNRKTEINEQPTSKGSATPTSSMPRIVKIESADREELLIGKKVRFEEKAPDEDETAEKNAKKLTFPSFRIRSSRTSTWFVGERCLDFWWTPERRVADICVRPGGGIDDGGRRSGVAAAQHSS